MIAIQVKDYKNMMGSEHQHKNMLQKELKLAQKKRNDHIAKSQMAKHVIKKKHDPLIALQKLQKEKEKQEKQF